MTLKQLAIKGVGLSLICMATLVEAVPVVVQNDKDSGIGSLAQAIIDVNKRTYDEIQFRFGLTDINLTAPLPPLTVPVKISGRADLNINLLGDVANVIFNFDPSDYTDELYLSGYDAGGSSNWGGGILGARGIIRLEQNTSSTYPGIISGDVSVICQDGGAGKTLTFGNTNTYTGGTSIPSGTLAVGIDNALPTSGTVDTSGGTLAIGNGFTQTLASVTGNGSVTNAGTLKIDSAANSTFGGVISGAGNFVKQGAAVFELTGNSTYTGTTEVLAGALKANAANTNDALPNTSVLSLASGTTLEIADNNTQTLQSITGEGEIAIDDNATLTAATVADGNFEGSITTKGAAGTFVKSGTHVLTLSDSHSNAASLQVAGGGIKIPTGGGWEGTVRVGGAALILDGGTVTQAITGNGGNTSSLEITGDFTPAADINDMGSVNVRSGGRLFLTKNITGGKAGSLVNEGTVTHTASAIRTISEDFTQETTGIINIGITDLTQYSQLQVGGLTTLNGGTMNVQVPTNAQIKAGDVFDIITSTGGITNNALPTVPRASLFLSFRPSVTGNILQLTANRSGCLCINNIPPLEGVAQQIDNLRGNDKFTPLIETLTAPETSQRDFEHKLEQLAPSGLNRMHAAVAAGHGAADQVLLRLDAARMGSGIALARAGYLRTGYAAGDVMEDQGSYSPIIFGNSTKQSSVLGLSGYKAATAGFGLLADAPVAQYFRAGLGISYANSVVRQANNTGSHTNIGSIQGMAYGSAHYKSLFLDAVLSAGINHYHGKRVITFMGPTAASSYRGFQYGAKVKAGFAIPCYQAEISPIAGVQYLQLNTGKYTETGADAVLNQHVDAMRTNTVRLSLGGRIGLRSEERHVFPELHAFYLRDIKNPPVTITSRFVEGGGSFKSTSIVLPKKGVNVGASITALLSERFAMSGGYDLESKKSFKSHSVSLKFKFSF